MFATILAEGLLLIVLATLASFFLYADALHQLSHAYQARYKSYVLAGELRTSSDDLTTTARLYVVTGNPQFRKEYEDILAIRDGKMPRPQQYNRIYWDFVSAGMPKPRPNGAQESFEERIRKAGFDGAEFAMLKQAEDRSNALAKREAIAMNAVVGLFPDKTGAFTIHGAPDRNLAIHMMFSPAYLREKAAIMEPIDRFFTLMDKRTKLAVVEAATNVSHYRVLTIVFLAMLALLALGASWATLRTRQANEEKWTKPVLRSGWSALPNIIVERQAELGLDPIDMNIVIHLLHAWTSADELPSPTVDKLAKDIGVSSRTVQKHIGGLQESGLIKRVERRNTRLGSSTNLYSLDGLVQAARRITDPMTGPVPEGESGAGERPEEGAGAGPGNVWSRIRHRLGAL
ncbi:MAG: hypothetical protein KGK10_01815 [Rhodospirillales bacterium]|nr:hypothetical protein [Rhodospirillales bacterium]